jgi:hypothetical protein
MDLHGVAAAILPLATTFCRKLGPGVTQFVSTLIQDHAVWQNTQFWEAAFFADCQKGIKDLYLALQVPAKKCLSAISYLPVLRIRIRDPVPF